MDEVTEPEGSPGSGPGAFGAVSRWICLRCDWSGEGDGGACPRCGVPLYQPAAPPAEWREEQAAPQGIAQVSPVKGDASAIGIPAEEEGHPPTVRRDWRRNKGIAAGVVGIGVSLVVTLIVTSGLPFQQTGGPAAPALPTIQPTPTPPASAVAEPDFMLDLNTGEMTPLPENIAGAEDLTIDYAASPDGSKLAYVRPGDNGANQIFVANLDGTGADQMTTDREAMAPAWSPDGSRIAYIGRRGDDPFNVLLLDATGASMQITFETGDGLRDRTPGWESPSGSSAPSFSPDGSSIVYSVGGEVRTIPISGGRSVRLVGGHGRAFAFDVQLSPDGELLSYGCGDANDRSRRCLANADGTDARILVGGGDAILSARWSPDATRIAYWEFHSLDVFVMDIATGEVTRVAEGASPVWIDDHTLIVKHDRCYGPRFTGCGG
jgi:hypothetical protein